MGRRNSLPTLPGTTLIFPGFNPQSGRAPTPVIPWPLPDSAEVMVCLEQSFVCHHESRRIWLRAGLRLFDKSYGRFGTFVSQGQKPMSNGQKWKRKLVDTQMLGHLNRGLSNPMGGKSYLLVFMKTETRGSRMMPGDTHPLLVYLSLFPSPLHHPYPCSPEAGRHVSWQGHMSPNLWRGMDYCAFWSQV